MMPRSLEPALSPDPRGASPALAGLERVLAGTTMDDARDGQLSLDRRLNRLASERTALFDKARVNFGLCVADQGRLHSIERELDECFLARRAIRAALDAQRFDRGHPFFDRNLKARSAK